MHASLASIEKIVIPLLVRLMSVQLCRMNDVLKWLWKLETPVPACTPLLAGNHLILAWNRLLFRAKLRNCNFFEHACCLLLQEEIRASYNLFQNLTDRPNNTDRKSNFYCLNKKKNIRFTYHHAPQNDELHSLLAWFFIIQIYCAHYSRHINCLHWYVYEDRS